MFRDIEMEGLASAMFDNEETVQNSKGDCWNGEEIHGRNDFAVVSQESGPAFASVVARRPAPEIAGDRALGDIETEFEELAVDSRCAPGGILIDQPPDDSSDLGIDLRPAKALRA